METESGLSLNGAARLRRVVSEVNYFLIGMDSGRDSAVGSHELCTLSGETLAASLEELPAKARELEGRLHLVARGMGSKRVAEDLETLASGLAKCLTGACPLPS